MLQNKIDILKKWIEDSENTVFFGGAGVSTESGIPDFRSTDGVYHMKYPYPPEKILSHSFFMSNTREFYQFYRDKMIYSEAKPNITHIKLARLEEAGMLNGIITQNIDGLHQKAGSKRVLELHGSVYRNYCMKCKGYYDLEDILEGGEVPVCKCSGIIKPDVVLYEEPLNDSILKEAARLISRCEVLIVGGTSLNVYPAASLLNYYQGNKLVLINKSITSYDNQAALLIDSGLGDVFSRL